MLGGLTSLLLWNKERNIFIIAFKKKENYFTALNVLKISKISTEE